jgi:hypothetical protein
MYPSTKPNSFVLCKDDETLPVDLSITAYNSSQPFAYYPRLESEGSGSARLSLDADLSELFSSLVDDKFASSWFASLETWKICPPPPDQSSLSVTDLKGAIKTIIRWLTQWIEKGSNPFIHPRLYRNRLPRCIQDAYATLSCYLHKSSSNEQIVFQIVEERMKQLLADNGISLANPLQENKSTSSTPLDSLEHIARVQALIVYQVLGLYGGDIRLRHLSETFIPVLKSWMREMVQHVSQEDCLGGSVDSSADATPGVGSISTRFTHNENFLWYSWILAESVRRTFIIGSGMQVTFLVLQKRDTVSCQGGMMFTTRQGAWEAQSAMAWEKVCSEVNVGLMQMSEAHRLFTESAPEEINEFTELVLGLIYGRERLQRWGIQIGD